MKYPYVVALEPVQVEFDDEKWPERLEPSVLEDVALGDFFYKGPAEIRRLGLVVRVLGESQTLVHVELSEVDDYRAVRQTHLRGVDHPSTLYRHVESLGKIRCVNYSAWLRQMSAARIRAYSVLRTTRVAHEAAQPQQYSPHEKSVHLQFSSFRCGHLSRKCKKCFLVV